MDPWRFQRWAFETPTGNPARKAILSMLAMMADATTGRCEAKQETLAQGVEISERAVRGHLKALAEAGLIARRAQYRADRGRRGDEFLLLAPGIETWPDGEPVHPADSSGGGGTQPRTPRKPASAQEQPPVNGHASKQADARERIPEGFPDELRPHARIVLGVLRGVAEDHHAKAVTAMAVGNTIMARPRKPLVKAAYDFAAWAANPPRPIRDAVASYRTWLDREQDLAAVEPLPGEASASNGNVPSRKADAAAAQQRRHEARRRLIEEARGGGT